MMGLLPRKRSDETSYLDTFCHYDAGLKKHLLCPEFYFAKISGVIVPNKFIGTWIIPDDPPRTMTAMAKYYAEERGTYEDHTDEPYARWDCPWCSGESEPIPAPRIVDCG